MRESVVRFENVGMRYGVGAEVLHDIGFELRPGSFHFLTGPSGAGKSSLLRLVYLAHRPSRGLIHIFGHDIATAKRDTLPLLRRRIGVVFQEFRLLDSLTVLENVALPLRIAGGDPLIERMPLWQCPVHTIWGECDALYGDNLAKIPAVMSRCNHVGFHVIPDAGHWVQYERPEAFNEVALRCLGPI